MIKKVYCIITALLVAISILPLNPIPSSAALVTNLITDGSFETTGGSPWYSPWTFSTGCSSVATPTQDSSNHIDGTYGLHMNITNDGGSDFCIELISNTFPLVANVTYVVSFWAKSSLASWSFVPEIKQVSPNIESQISSVTVTNTWQYFSIPFTEVTTTTASEIALRFGANNGDMWIDQVALASGATVPNYSVTNASLALGNSIPVTSTTDTIAFTPADTTDTVKFIQLEYATTSAGQTIPTSLTMSSTPTVTVKNNGATLSNTAAYTSSAGILTITLSTPTALTASGSAVTIAVAGVTNPVAGVFYIQGTTQDANGNMLDYGVVATETIAGIAMQAQLDPNLTFTVTGLATGGGPTGACGSTTTGADQSCTATSTSTAISFGSLSNSTTNTAVQEITTATNAAEGYTVVLQENQALTSGSNTIANVSASTTWTLNTTTGFGISATNATSGDTYTTNFASSTIYQPVPINTTTLTLASKSSPTAGAGDSEYISFQI